MANDQPLVTVVYRALEGSGQLKLQSADSWKFRPQYAALHPQGFLFMEPCYGPCNNLVERNALKF